MSLGHDQLRSVGAEWAARPGRPCVRPSPGAFGDPADDAQPRASSGHSPVPLRRRGQVVRGVQYGVLVLLVLVLALAADWAHDPAERSSTRR